MGKVLLMLLFFCSVLEGLAVTYDYDPDIYRKLRLNVPDGTSEIRGILVFGNGAGGDSRGMATNGELVAFAKRIGFAVLATGSWGNFGDNGYEIALFEAALGHYASVANFPEIVDAPWLPMGHSNGGQMSYGLNTLRPSKVIGFITSKGGYYNSLQPSLEALRTPGLLIAGQKDTQLRRDNIRALFTENRPRGALWAWAEEENTGHEEADSQQLKLSFLAECYRLRYPRDQSPRNGPVQLKPLNEWEGWLVDQNTWATGFTSIYRYDQYPGDPRSLGWVPTERTAHLYRSFSSYKRISYTAGISPNPVTAPATLSYSVDLTGKTWDKIEFYEGGTKLAESTPVQSGSVPKINLPVQTGGLYTLHAVITAPDQTRTTSKLRRVFVNGPMADTPFETWAKTQFPTGQAGRACTPLEDGIANLTRWSFGLDCTNGPDLNRMPHPAATTELVDGIPYRSFEYTINPEARNADASFTPYISLDLVNWYKVETSPLQGGIRTERIGDLVRVKVPELSKLFLKVVVDDPLSR